MTTKTQRTRNAQRTTKSQTLTQTKVKDFISTTILLTVRTYINIITDNTPALAEDNVDTEGKLQYTAKNRRHEMNHNYLLLGPEDLSNSVFTDVETTVTGALQLISSGTLDLGPVVIDHDDSCDVEERKIARFVAHGCTCKHGKGKTPCHTQFTASQYRHQRDECQELTRDELDLVVMGQLQALTKRDSLTQKEKATNTERLQTSTVYQFGGHRICYITKLDAIRKSWVENGLQPRRHANSVARNATKLSDVEDVVRFICCYAQSNAILLPGRIPGYKRDDLQLLPSSVTKKEVWQQYEQSTAQREGTKAVCYSLSCRFWRQLTPHVVVTKPMSDLCWTCQKNSTMIMRAHNRPVEEKSEVSE